MKLWPKSFNDDKKWGFDILDEVTTFYKNHKFISEEETKRCTRQWPLFRSRVSKLKVEKIYDVYVDILDENEYDIDCILILLSIMMTISCGTCECEKGFSCMNRQKTNEKINMPNDTLNNVMLISVNGPDIS